MKKEKFTGAKTKQQIAEEYRICRKTLSRWLMRENIKTSKSLITPKEQEIIYKKLGKPENVPYCPVLSFLFQIIVFTFVE